MERGLTAAGWVGLVGSGAWRQAAGAQAGREENPFAYDVGRLAKTDPSLIGYREVRRFRSPHDEARRLAIGADGRIYVAAGNYVAVLSGDGAPLLEIALGGPARCVAVDGEGRVFVGLRDHVEVFDPKGQRRGVWESAGPRSWLTSLAATAQGIFAADAGNRVVLRYDAGGNLVGRLGGKDKTRNTPGLIVPSPFLTVGWHPDGLLRVNNPGRHRVEAYTVDGELEFTWGKASGAIEGFCGCCNPVSLAVLSDGRIVTCEKGLPRVKVYRADGTFECVVAGVESFPENYRVAAGEGLSDGTHGGLDAAVDTAGRIHILDLVTAEIRVMEPKGGLEGKTSRKAPAGT